MVNKVPGMKTNLVAGYQEGGWGGELALGTGGEERDADRWGGKD